VAKAILPVVVRFSLVKLMAPVSELMVAVFRIAAPVVEAVDDRIMVPVSECIVGNLTVPVEEAVTRDISSPKVETPST